MFDKHVVCQVIARSESAIFVNPHIGNMLFPWFKLFIEHSLCRGFYCNFKKKGSAGSSSSRPARPLTDGDVASINQRMEEIIALDMPFRRTESTTEEAIRVFRDRGFSDKVKLLETSGQIYSDYYTLGDTVDYYYGPLVPSAGYLTVWDLERYEEGLLLRVPDWNDPSRLAEKIAQPKTFEMFAEKTRWVIIIGCRQRRRREQGHPAAATPRADTGSEALQERRLCR